MTQQCMNKNKIQKWQEISIWVYYISCLSSKYLNYNLPILKLNLFTVSFCNIFYLSAVL